MTLTDGGGDVPGEDLLALPDGQLRPQLQPQVGELDVVGVVEAGVVDEAVHRVQRHPGLPPAVRLQLHPVGADDADHALHVGLAKVGEVGGLLQQQYHLQLNHTIAIKTLANY